VRLLVIVVAVSTALVACNGSHSGRRPAAQFDQGLAEVTASFRASTEHIKSDGRAALASSDSSKVLAVYASLRDATAAAAQRYHELTPPAGKSEAFTALIKNIDEQKAALDQVVQGAKKQQSSTVATALRRYASLLQQWAAALSRLGGVGSSGTTG
jgi:hypothetical protein